MGLKRYYLKLSFLSVEDLTKVKREIQPAVRKNKERDKSTEVYTRYDSMTVTNNERRMNLKAIY